MTAASCVKLLTLELHMYFCTLQVRVKKWVLGKSSMNEEPT